MGISKDLGCVASNWIEEHKKEVILAKCLHEQWTSPPTHPNRLNCVGESPLDSAIFEGPDAVAEQISQGADINKKGSLGRTTLHFAVSCCFRSWVITIVQKLLELGADPNAKNSISCTPLFFVCRSQNPVPLVKLLFGTVRMSMLLTKAAILL